MAATLRLAHPDPTLRREIPLRVDGSTTAPVVRAIVYHYKHGLLPPPPPGGWWEVITSSLTGIRIVSVNFANLQRSEGTVLCTT